MKPNIGISQKNLDAVNKILCEVLGDAHVLYIKLRKFHWNVSGPSFLEIHRLFEEQYDKVEEAIDEIAERISKLGFTVPGTMAEFIKLSTLKETVGKNPNQEGMIKELLNDHEAIIRSLRKKVGDCEDKFEDSGTGDFLNGLMQEHETMAWMLRKYLTK